jgi:signal transduction histidine kinase
MDQLDRDRLVSLIDVGRGLMAELDPEALLRRILGVARELTAARYAAIGILDERQTELERFITLGIDDATHAAIGDLPRGRGVLGELIRHPEPLRLEDVSYHPRSYGFPIGHPQMHTFVGVPILVRGQAWGNLYLTEKADGADFTGADEEALVVLADWAAIAIQNARLYGGVLERRDELERVVATLAATDEIARAVGGELELERILELIAKRGRALVEARALLIALLEGDELRIAAAAGQVPQDMLGAVANIEGTVGGSALRTGRTERLGVHASGLRAPWAKALGAGSGLIVPLRFRARSLGVIAAYDRYGDDPEFSADDERLMEAFAVSAATAVATGQHVVAEGLRQTLEASERERGRWARELHDETLQEMGALKLLLAGARRSDDVTKWRDALDRGVSQLEEGIEQLRALITDLRPAALDQLGTGAALEALIDRVSGQSGLAISLDIDLDYEQGRAAARHEPNFEATIYRIVQEALTNVVKHAEATSVAVSVRELDGIVDLSVRDNGKGFDVDRRAAGFGLVGIRERVALARGTLAIHGSPGAGTEILARLPVLRSEARHEESQRTAAAESAG